MSESAKNVADRSPAAPRGPLGRFASGKASKVVGFAVGLVLLAAAAASVARGHEGLERAWELARGCGWWMIPLLVLLPAINVAMASLTFYVLTRPGQDGRPTVGGVEMLALIASANLGNYMPLRAGMLGRVTYHRVVNGIPLAESAGVIALALSATASAVALLLGASLLAASVKSGGVGTTALLSTPAVALLAVAWTIRRTGGHAWRWFAAAGFRYVEMLVWMARYAIAFFAVGRTLSPLEAGAFTAAAQGAMVIPLTGNGVGLREWVIGLVAPMLPPELIGAAGATTTLALSADLLNRGCEVVAAVGCGLWGAGWVARRLATAQTTLSGDGT